MKKTCEENQGMYFKIDTYQNVVASAATSCTLKPRRRTHSQLEFFSSKPIKNQNFYNQKQSVPNTKAYGYVENEFSPTKHAMLLLVYQTEKQNQLKARKHKTFSYQRTEHNNIFLFSEPCFLSTYFTNLNMMLQPWLLKFLFYTEIYF